MSQTKRLPRPVLKQIAEADAVRATLDQLATHAPAATTTPAPDATPPPTATTTPAPDATPPTATTTPAPDAAPAPAPAPDAAPAPDGKDWQQMYSVLRGKYDKEVPELKASVAELIERNRQNETLLAQLADRPKPAEPASNGKLPDPTIFSAKELEDYGSEFFDVVARRAQQIVDAKLGPLQEKLAKYENQNTNSQRIEEERARHAVYRTLDEQVPDWQAINGQQTFLAWLAGSDVFSSKTKRELLTEAFQTNDAARVVQFFKAFQEDSARQSAPAARTPSVDAGTLVAPGTPRSGAPAVAPGGSDRVWTQAEIGEVFSQHRRGKISSDDFKRLEKEIVRAAAEGRVR